MKYETLLDVVNGRLVPKDRQAFNLSFANWPDGPVRATFQSAMVFRSPGQNRFWHAAIVRPLAEHCGVSPRAMHDALTILFLPETVVVATKDGMELYRVTVGGATGQLTRNEASNIIDRGVALAECIPLDVGPRPRDLDVRTHFIPWDSPTIGRQQRALCGELVRSGRHANDPTCPDCRGRLADTSSPA